MIARVKLVKDEVKPREEEPKKKLTRVKLEKTSSLPRVKLNRRVRLEKSETTSKYFFSESKPHLHKRIVPEAPRAGERIIWVKERQSDGTVLYDRIVQSNDNFTSRLLLTPIKQHRAY